MDFDAGVDPQLALGQVGDGHNSVKGCTQRAHRPGKRKSVLPRPTDPEQRENNASHILLFPAISWWIMDDTVFILPDVRGWGCRRNFGRTAAPCHLPQLAMLRSRGNVFAPSSSGHHVLMWRCGDLDSWPNLLSDSSGNQPPRQSTHKDAPDATRRFLQRSDATHLHRGKHLVAGYVLARGPCRRTKTCRNPSHSPGAGANIPSSCHKGSSRICMPLLEMWEETSAFF